MTDAEFEYEFVDLYGSKIYERYRYNVEYTEGFELPLGPDASWFQRVNNVFFWDKSPEGLEFWNKICNREYVSLSDLKETQYVPPRCECGAIIARSPVHSDWCPLYKAEELI